MSLADISVVVPCYNASKTIARALDSVLMQKLQPREVIVVDDGSQDFSLNIVRDYVERYDGDVLFKVLSLFENRGPSCARNIGWSLSACKYIAFLDADDSWHKEKLSIQYGLMSSNQCIDMTACKVSVFDQAVGNLSKKYKVLSPAIFLFKNFFNCPAVMLKANLNLRFDESKRFAEDYDLWLRLVFSGCNAALIDSELVYVHKPFYGKSGLSSSMFKMWCGEFYAYLGLHRNNKISFGLCSLSIIFSFFKLLIRYMKTTRFV